VSAIGRPSLPRRGAKAASRSSRRYAAVECRPSACQLHETEIPTGKVVYISIVLLWYRDFLCFFSSRWLPPPSWFLKIWNFNGLFPIEGQYASLCQNSSKSVKRLRRYGDLTFFQNGGRPPSWICWACIGTTHKDYLVVFIVEQKLVGIAAVLSIIWKF